jgi:hypothetical protein
MELPVGWLEREGLAMLQRAAEQLGVPTPGLAPRLSLRPGNEPLPDADRLAQSTKSTETSSRCRTSAPLTSSSTATTSGNAIPQGPDEHWRWYELLAERVIDLDAGAVR